jgi:hypothetical protein
MQLAPQRFRKAEGRAGQVGLQEAALKAHWAAMHWRESNLFANHGPFW